MKKFVPTTVWRGRNGNKLRNYQEMSRTGLDYIFDWDAYARDIASDMSQREIDKKTARGGYTVSSISKGLR